MSRTSTQLRAGSNRHANARCQLPAAAPAFESLEPRQLFAAGALDSLFSFDGRTTFDFPGPNNPDFAGGVAIQADGKIIAAGQATADADGSSPRVALARYNRDGTLDSSFGNAGTVVSDAVVGTPWQVVGAVGLQSDGRIVVVGTAIFSGENHFMVARYNTNGTLDTSFGYGGSNASTDFAPGIASEDLGMSVAIQSDDRIDVAGTAVYAGAAHIAIARFTPNGVLDNSFSGDGLATVPSGAGLGQAVAVAPSGDIHVAGSGAGSGNGDFSISRFNGSGTYLGSHLTDFGGTSDSANAIAIDQYGRILVAGSSGTSSDGTHTRWHVTTPT